MIIHTILVLAFSQNPTTGFRYEAPISTSQPAFFLQLKLTAEVIEQCAAHCSDLRIFSSAGREVPYRMILGSADADSLVRQKARVIDVDRQRAAIDFTHAIDWKTHEFYRIAIPENVHEPLSLSLDVTNRDFDARAEVILRSRKPSKPIQRIDKSIFRLLDGNSQLILFEGDVADFNYVDVLIKNVSTMRQGYLNPTFHWQRNKSEEKIANVGLKFENVSASEVLLSRPRGVHPQSLQFSFTEATYRRTVTVFDVDAAGQQTLVGNGTVSKLGESVSSAVSLTSTPVGKSLRVVFSKASGQSIQLTSVDAVVALPTLVFEWPRLGETYVLRVGNETIEAPSYEIAQFGDVEISSTLRSSSAATLGTLGPREVITLRQPLSEYARPGTRVELGRFKYLAPLAVSISKQSLVEIELSSEVAKKISRSMDDVRIVDANNTQWPYVRLATPRYVDEPISVAKKKSRAPTDSVVELSLSGGPAQIESLAVYFSTSAKNRLTSVHTAADPPSLLWRGGVSDNGTRLKIPLQVFGEAFQFSVHDNDDAPTEVQRVVATLALPRIVAALGPGAYRIAFAAADMPAPSYAFQSETAAVPFVEGIERVSVGAIIENQEHSKLLSTLSNDTRMKRIAMWVAIAMAALVVGFLTYRLAKAENN